MSTAENMALSRRVDKLERALLAVEPVRIRTTLAVTRRGAEERCRTLDDVYRVAKLDPVVEVFERRRDLDVIIDAEAGVHLIRLEGDDPEYDELAEGLRTIDVEIACYPEQLEQILSDAPITASVGGTRAGKTRVLVWWLFRQWLLRGHGANEHHEIEAVFWWIREDSQKLYKHAVLWIERLWPADVFVTRPSPTAKELHHTLIDGSRIDYKHAHHSGSKAGTSLRSESVEALVVDELSAVHHEENWREMKSRVAQTGGPIATAFTPTAGHWSEGLEKGALASGGAVVVRALVMTMNPWWPFARMWVDLLKDNAITATQLVEQILPANDPAYAARELVTDPHVLRMRWGVSAPVGLVLWREWDPVRYTSTDYDEDRDVLRLHGRELPNITGLVLGQFFRGSSMLVEGRELCGGKDFNINPNVTIIFSLHGNSREPHVYVHDEVADVGPTLRNAKHVARLYPRLCIFCDPTGAMDYRHESHGSQSMSDAEEMRRQGLECEPANGQVGATVKHIPPLDPINAMHRAMSMGLLRVHPRCVGVLRALSDMRAQPDGRPKKVSGVRSESDMISAFGDALRYGVWPAWEPLLVAESAA